MDWNEVSLKLVAQTLRVSMSRVSHRDECLVAQARYLRDTESHQHLHTLPRATHKTDV